MVTQQQSRPSHIWKKGRSSTMEIHSNVDFLFLNMLLTVSISKQKALPAPPKKTKQNQKSPQKSGVTFYEKGKAYSRELQEGPTGLVGGVIGSSLGSMNEVKDVVDDVLLFEGVLSVHGIYNVKQELLQEGDARGADSTQQCGASDAQKKWHVAYLDMINSVKAVDTRYKFSDRRGLSRELRGDASPDSALQSPYPRR